MHFFVLETDFSRPKRFQKALRPMLTVNPASEGLTDLRFHLFSSIKRGQFRWIDSNRIFLVKKSYKNFPTSWNRESKIRALKNFSCKIEVCDSSEFAEILKIYLWRFYRIIDILFRSILFTVQRDFLKIYFYADFIVFDSLKRRSISFYFFHCLCGDSSNFWKCTCGSFVALMFWTDNLFYFVPFTPSWYASLCVR